MPKTVGHTGFITAAAILAAIIYNSWPLGYLLNPSVAGTGLASDFEASGQPYNWFFVACDVLFGVLVVSLTLWLMKDRAKWRSSIIYVAGLAAFGIFTAVSALIPLHCHADIRTCGYDVDQTLGWHDITGAIAALGLFAAMAAAIGWAAGRLSLAMKLITLVWSLTGLWFLYVSVVNDHFWTSAIVPSQEVFLVLSGIGPVLAVYIRVKSSPK